ncbi:LysR family transcriptional regulator [Marinobacterium marinum]|uniref:LysR family transcriptional regulator n=1 Tax=Marinobacterium marinum TaxID=2756129 RepID=A0A7W1WX86_9GAMM|nr:LysR family transcriptional regulator [Marinobacterium marinum]MBA4501817.1 LysR family transcriptional regulator [Marinobacterium marinum]
MRTITLEDVLIFRTVVREGGIHRAANALNRVPSNVTTRIKRFEARLGCALFQRQGRQLVLTGAGRRLLGHADALLDLADEIERDMTSRELSGPLRLGSLESAAAVRLPDVLSGFHRQYPDILVDLCTGSTGVLLERLREYRIDAALVSEPFDPGGLNVLPVFREKLVLVTAQGHAPVSSPAVLQGRAIAAFSQGCSYRHILLEWLSTEAVVPRRIMELGSYHAILACVAAGAAVGVVPLSVLETAVCREAVQLHALPDRWAYNCTHLVWRGAPGVTLQKLIALLEKTGRSAFYDDTDTF